MSLNTYPYNPFPASTDKLDEAHNAELQQDIDQLKSGLTNLGNIRTYVIPANGSVNIKITKVGFVLYAPARSAFFMDAISYDQGYLDTILGDKTSSNRNTYTVVSDTNIRVTSSMNWDIAIIVLSA